MPLELEFVLRLLLSAVLAGAVGLEREISDQPAGFRTHMLVSLGACLFALVSAYSVEGLFDGDRPVGVRFDPTRIAAQIVTGIGFLGAGAIIRYGMSVRGLTTAASLWVVAAIGMAVGFGGYLLASVTAVITVLALFGLKRVRGRLVRGLKKEHEEFVLEAGPDLQLERLVSEVSRAGVRIDRLNVEEEEGEGLRHVLLTVTLSPQQLPEDFVGVLTRTPGVRNVDWTR
jgi:putative Mg2+ transporter-C (MgtC) family protein